MKFKTIDLIKGMLGMFIALIIIFISIAAADSPEKSSENQISDQSSDSYQIDWFVISEGAVENNSASYEMQATVSQTVVEECSSASFKVLQGYWQGLDESSSCLGKCGDANNDNNVNVSDAVYIINYVFSGGGAPNPVLACGDSNGDGSVNVSDAVHLINYVFSGGSAPGDCSPDDFANDCCPFSL